MLICYARVSTQDQTLDLQTDALKRAGCEKLFTDTTSGSKSERSGLQDVMNHLRAGDTLVVWRLDRLGRSLKHLIETITELEHRGIGFKRARQEKSEHGWLLRVSGRGALVAALQALPEAETLSF